MLIINVLYHLHESDLGKIIHLIMDIQIVFKPVGNTPILRQNKYSYRLNLERNQPFVELINYLDHLLWPDPHQKQPLYLYINSVFIPAMDEQLVNLYKVIDCC